MKLKPLVLVSAFATMSLSTTFAATNFSAEQKKEVEQIVHEYLVKNPEVLVEASQALQQKQQHTMQEQAKDAIIQNASQLFTEELAVTGNPKGDVTLVEFFDYQCVHCKKMKPVIKKLVKNDKNLRVIYKEFPIFGKSSELASKAALAAALQDKYQPMHDALLSIDKRLNEKVIMEAAKSVGLDIPKLKKDMSGETVKKALKENRELAEKMHLMGTPAFIVAATPGGQFKKDSDPAFIPGAASAEALQDMINKVEK